MLKVNNVIYTTLADYVMTGGIVEISLDTFTQNKRFKLPTDTDWEDLDVQELWTFANSVNEDKINVVSILDVIQSLPLIKSYAPVTHTWSSEPPKEDKE
nr:MAG TPA: hypothetical protein [Caudoviricetes sp.]